MTVTSPKTTTIGSYLFRRLHQLGVKSIFGVPGDYNLDLLDHVEPSGVQWIGNCNELNAAYAADGYAKLNGLGALVTTFGVGELSAANGIAGAYCEKAPVVHIVGTPSRQLQESRTPVHHTFADGEYRRFAAMHTHITVAQVNIRDPRTAVSQIDWILDQAQLHSRPVYLELPQDLVNVTVDLTNQQPALNGSQLLPQVSESSSEAAKYVLELMYLAKRPLILVDSDSRPCRILDQIDQLVQDTNWPTWMTTSGKGLVNEQVPNVYGVWKAKYSPKAWQTYFESADLVLHLGPHISNTNTEGFAAVPNKEITISFRETEVLSAKKSFRDLSCSEFLRQLLSHLQKDQLAAAEKLPEIEVPTVSKSSNDLITQDKFFNFVDRLFESGDVVLTETGTAAYGSHAFRLPPNVRRYTATTWLSIGYMLPATLGAAISQRERIENSSNVNGNSSNPCTILFIGDGSLQMSVQEISTMIRHNLNIIIFIINNDGYTIERAIHGKDQSYNDVASWRYLDALRYFGDDMDHAKGSVFSAKTWAELDTALNEVRKGDGVRLVEVFMGREDCTGILLDLLKAQDVAAKE